MRILGISGWKNLKKYFPNTDALPLHDASAALIVDDEIIAVGEEERFTRKKHGYDTFPVNAAAFCLKEAKLTLDDIDKIAIYWDFPYHAKIKGEKWTTKNEELVERIFPKNLFPRNKNVEVVFVNHHLSHAVSAWSCSSFNESIVIVVDGQGEDASTSVWVAKENKLSLLRKSKSSASLGFFYEALTEFVGLEANEPGKTMGLASFGKPIYDLKKYFKIDDGVINLTIDPEIDEKSDFDEQKQVRKYWKNIFSSIINKENVNTTEFNKLSSHFDKNVEFNEEYKNLAASGQEALEKVMLKLVEWTVKNTGIKNLCLAGGVSLNCVMNGKILQSGLIKDVFIQPMAHDAGAALGAAQACNDKKISNFQGIYLGPEFSEEEIISELQRNKVTYKKSNNVCLEVAKLLNKGNIIGWFQGKMEVGPRALGNRSILANPILSNAKDLVNKHVKFREMWRPFAPSLLEEDVDIYLVNAHKSPYMILNFEVKKEALKKIPGVLHIDNTVRPHTVTEAQNKKYYELIKEFKNITGVGVILNTSFNVKGEPIVCTPRDALRTFYSCGMDYLILGDFIIAK
ncbi:MAG: carbamoyltransferase [Candidatus Woesearchaeota archaeon]